MAKRKTDTATAYTLSASEAIETISNFQQQVVRSVLALELVCRVSRLSDRVTVKEILDVIEPELAAIRAHMN